MTSGAAIARVFHRLLALVLLVAWLSLAVQVRVLIGARGLEPVGAFLEEAARGGATPRDLPTLFWLGSSDVIVVGGCVAGIGLALLALAGRWPRVAFLLSIPLYVSYITACRSFLSFQWDNLLVESLFLAVWLPADRPSPWIHLAFRVLLFKLYFESGVAKWQSHLRDWQDGSAMTAYYETAPIPTALAWWAHRLPAAWHHFESWFTLVFELGVPWLAFGPRKARLAAFAVLSTFQIVNTLTANYGFFTYLAFALGVFLLADDDVPRRFRPKTRASGTSYGALVFVAATTVLGAWTGLAQFADVSLPLPIARVLDRVPVLNVYHLFGSITRERIEPDFQVLKAGQWQSQVFHFKPGPVDRAPPFVAPHQPRVDFRLWFYGLGYAGKTPDYVVTLLSRLCHDPDPMDSLFVGPPIESPDAVRIVYWRYHFTSDGVAPTGAEVGKWWTRELVEATPTLPCARVP